jgi:hypothetical protein
MTADEYIDHMRAFDPYYGRQEHQRDFAVRITDGTIKPSSEASKAGLDAAAESLEKLRAKLSPPLHPST